MRQATLEASEEEKWVAVASLAAAKDISVDAAVVTVLSELG